MDASEATEFIKGVNEDCLVVIDAAYNEFASFKDSKKHLEPCELIKELTMCFIWELFLNFMD